MTANQKHHCCLVAKLRPTLFDSMDCSLPGSSVYGISQARILKWGAIAFSNSANAWSIVHSVWSIVHAQ